MALTFLRPFDALSLVFYTAAFRAGRRLGWQVRERCGEPSQSLESTPEAVQVPDAPTFVLPGATIQGVEVDPFWPTPENSLVVDLCATADDATHEARRADAMAALDAGKAVVFGDVAADKGLFAIGKLDGRYVVSVGMGPLSNFADLDAAMRHGLGSVEGYL